MSLLLLSALLCLVSCQLRLIEFGPSQRKWMKQEEVLALPKAGLFNNFIDVTDYPNVDLSTAPVNADPYPNGAHHQAVVDALLPDLKIPELEAGITSLSNFLNRNYQTATGKEAAIWIHDKYLEYGSGKDYIEVEYFEHTWLQPSVITRMKGSDPTADGIIIIGSHEDTVGTTRFPGADDDASGTASVLEIFRVLTKHNFRPLRTVEFHAYAAEEAGLLGSGQIAAAYRAKNVKVWAMMQLDMTAYTRSGFTPVFGLITDYVNVSLVDYLSQLVDEYASIGWAPTACGYGCSDHASWNRFGYPSSFPFEATSGNTNPYIHTIQDSLDKLNLEHAIEFVKLGLAYIVELGLTPDKK